MKKKPNQNNPPKTCLRRGLPFSEKKKKGLSLFHYGQAIFNPVDRNFPCIYRTKGAKFSSRILLISSHKLQKQNKEYGEDEVKNPECCECWPGLKEGSRRRKKQKKKLFVNTNVMRFKRRCKLQRNI